MNMQDSSMDPDIITVQAIFEKRNLVIPGYQRPYKWQEKHVRQLMVDVAAHAEKGVSRYRLGTLVFQQDKADGQELKELNIVDGQQRVVTLALMDRAIRKMKRLMEGSTLAEYLEARTTSLDFLQPRGQISEYNTYRNYQEICRCLESWNAKTVDFFYKQCELVTVTLTEVGEAFQFFDSQNSRGKDLSPHDLLKAYHLREMSEQGTQAQEKAVQGWENRKPEKLEKLFADYLYRIRNWSKGRSARYFTKDEIGLFKGITLHEIHYPYSKPQRMLHGVWEDYLRHPYRHFNDEAMTYPHQLDQVIINGSQFFEWVEHFAKTIDENFKGVRGKNKKLGEILSFLGRYQKRGQIGDGYVRNLFDCSLHYYLDRFGEAHLDAVASRLFLWAYQVRLDKSRVYLASIDNHAMDQGVFQWIREARNPMDMLEIGIRTKFKEPKEYDEEHPDSIKDLITYK